MRTLYRMHTSAVVDGARVGAPVRRVSQQWQRRWVPVPAQHVMMRTTTPTTGLSGQCIYDEGCVHHCPLMLEAHAVVFPAVNEHAHARAPRAAKLSVRRLPDGLFKGLQGKFQY